MTALYDRNGKPVIGERLLLVQTALACLKACDEATRGLVLCWFCRGCSRFLGPGEDCHCENDE